MHVDVVIASISTVLVLEKATCAGHLPSVVCPTRDKIAVVRGDSVLKCIRLVLDQVV